MSRPLGNKNKAKKEASYQVKNEREIFKKTSQERIDYFKNKKERLSAIYEIYFEKLLKSIAENNDKEIRRLLRCEDRLNRYEVRLRKACNQVTEDVCGNNRCQECKYYVETGCDYPQNKKDFGKFKGFVKKEVTV